MSTRGKVGVMRTPVASPMGLEEIHRDRTAQALDFMPFRDGVPILGITSSEGFLTDGVSFTAGQARELAHNLGRNPTGVMVLDAQGTAAGQIVRDQANLTKDLDPTRMVRVKNVGASTLTVKLWVW